MKAGSIALIAVGVAGAYLLVRRKASLPQGGAPGQVEAYPPEALPETRPLPPESAPVATDPAQAQILSAQASLNDIREALLSPPHIADAAGLWEVLTPILSEYLPTPLAVTGLADAATARALEGALVALAQARAFVAGQANPTDARGRVQQEYGLTAQGLSSSDPTIRAASWSKVADDLRAARALLLGEDAPEAPTAPAANPPTAAPPQASPVQTAVKVVQTRPATTYTATISYSSLQTKINALYARLINPPMFAGKPAPPPPAIANIWMHLVLAIKSGMPTEKIPVDGALNPATQQAAKGAAQVVFLLMQWADTGAIDLTQATASSQRVVDNLSAGDSGARLTALGDLNKALDAAYAVVSARQATLTSTLSMGQTGFQGRSLSIYTTPGRR